MPAPPEHLGPNEGVIVESPIKLSGMVTFAGILAVMIGAFNAIAGLAALTEDDGIKAYANEVLFGVDVTVWGWIWLIIGVVQVVTGVMIVQRHPSGLMFGVAWATIAATLSVFTIFAYPIAAFTGLIVEVAILWALLKHADEFETAA